MSFFSKKKEVDLETTCRIFYENVILNCIVDDVDINAQIFDTLRNALVAVDQNFARVEPKKFNDEIIILQFELFALAWLYQFGDKSAIAQSVFTKTFLHEKQRDDIWENSEDYNQAIARSSTAGKSKEKAFDRVYLARVYKTRADLFDQFHKDGFDPKCVARALNRLFSDDAWKRGVTAGFLLFALCSRLGFDQNFEPSKEAHSRWFIEINDLFEKTMGSLKKIQIKG